MTNEIFLAGTADLTFDLDGSCFLKITTISHIYSPRYLYCNGLGNIIGFLLNTTILWCLLNRNQLF